MDIETLITQFNAWKATAISSMTNLTTRTWFMYGLTETPSQKTIAAKFDRTALNAEYKKRYSQRDDTKMEPYAYIQMEIDLIYGAHKSFVARHKTRLQHYRDDAAQKDYFMGSSVAVSLGKFRSDREDVEK